MCAKQRVIHMLHHVVVSISTTLDFGVDLGVNLIQDQSKYLQL